MSNSFQPYHQKSFCINSGPEPEAVFNRFRSFALNTRLKIFVKLYLEHEYSSKNDHFSVLVFNISFWRITISDKKKLDPVFETISHKFGE